MNNNVQIDSAQVDNLLDKLMDDELKRNILFKAVKEGAKVLQDNTKKSFRSVMGAAASKPNSWNGKAFSDGITLKADKAYCEAVVSIMGDYRLKFFEKGTKQRRTKGRKIVGYASNGRNLKREGKGHYTGAIKAKYFFKDARNQSETAIDEAMIKSIQTALNKL